MSAAVSETLAVVELRSVPSGLGSLDALVKQAQVQIRFAGDIDPSRFLVVFDGPLADVEAALDRAIEVGGDDVLETLLLARAHSGLLQALRGEMAETVEPMAKEQALGVLQAHTVIGVIAATDRALKVAEVALLRLRLATELAGQGHAVLVGDQFAVEASLQAAVETSQSGVQIETRLIPRASVETYAAAAQRALGPRALRPLDA